MSPRLLSVALATAWLAYVAQPAAAQSINEQVVRYCKKMLDKQVGGGECSSLAYYALKAAHAKELNDFKDRPHEGDYVWGKLVYVLRGRKKTPAEKIVAGQTVKPGDILQYRNAKFEGKGYSYSYGHHTAVVLAINLGTREMTVLEQNINGKRFVQQSHLNLNDLRTGWLRIYRPVAKK